MENISYQIAKHLREVHFGGNWTCVNLKALLQDVDWQLATRRLHNLNTIAVLVNHLSYYVQVQLDVLHGKALNAKDTYSFEHPPIQSSQDWENMLLKVWKNAEELATAIEQFPESRLGDFFVEQKFGSYYRNFHGMIEHTHYHLGQIALIKKFILETDL